MKVPTEIIAQKVHERTKPSFNLRDVANSLGISRQALGRRLTGEVRWRYDELEQLARLLGITLEQLVGENHVNDTTVGDAS